MTKVSIRPKMKCINAYPYATQKRVYSYATKESSKILQWNLWHEGKVYEGEDDQRMIEKQITSLRICHPIKSYQDQRNIDYLYNSLNLVAHENELNLFKI